MSTTEKRSTKKATIEIASPNDVAAAVATSGNGTTGWAERQAAAAHELEGFNFDVGFPPVSMFAKASAERYPRYGVSLTFIGNLAGGVPKSTSLIEGWLRSKMGVTDEQEMYRQVLLTMQSRFDVPIPEIDELLQKAEITAPEYQTAVATAERVAEEDKTTGFKRDANGVLYVESRQIKAMLKENTSILFSDQRWGPTKKGARSYLTERVFVKPDRIPLGVTEPSEIHMQIGHVTGPQGKRSTLGYHEVVTGASIHFEVLVLDDAIKSEWWNGIWPSAELNGLGALRSQGFGQFVVTAFERIS